MSKPNVTPWFQKRESPVHPGVYEIRCSISGYHWSYFDGDKWNGAWPKTTSAFTHRRWFKNIGDEGGATYLEVWRGLAADPRSTK